MQEEGSISDSYLKKTSSACEVVINHDANTPSSGYLYNTGSTSLSGSATIFTQGSSSSFRSGALSQSGSVFITLPKAIPTSLANGGT